MEHNYIGKADIKKKSEEYQVSFSSLLAGYILEELMYLISDSDYSEVLWLKNHDYFTLSNYEKKQSYDLKFVYHEEEKVLKTSKMIAGQRLSEELSTLMFENIFVKEKNKKIKWKWNLCYKDGSITAKINAEFEEMKVPIQIQIDTLHYSGITSEKMELSLFIDENVHIKYRHYPIEIILSEYFLQILNLLELIPAMDNYALIYEIITQNPIDGRHVAETLSLLCKEAGLSFDEKRIELLASYQDYTYMKKRWEKFEKRRKKEKNDSELREWQDVLKTELLFITPVWNALCKDEVFFGDWMPELRRFLD